MGSPVTFAAVAVLAIVGLWATIWKLSDHCMRLYREWERRVQEKAPLRIADAKAEPEKEKGRETEDA